MPLVWFSPLAWPKMKQLEFWTVHGYWCSWYMLAIQFVVLIAWSICTVCNGCIFTDVDLDTCKAITWMKYSTNNNNNKAFKSQTSWGRLELKPSRNNQGSGTWIAVFQALLSKAKSLDIFHPFKSPFIVSTQVNFGLPLPLFTLLSWLGFHYAPVSLEVSVGMSKPSQPMFN